MDKECYKDIEKIKTIGSTYMAAVGLVPTIGTKVVSQFVFLCIVVHTTNECSTLKGSQHVGSFHVSLLTASSLLQAKKSIYDHLSTIADYAIEMFDVLDEINYQSYNEFVLRVGTLSFFLNY